MGKQIVKCSYGQRLFDVYEGSNVNIEVKCSNKNCKYKSKCKKKEVVFVGNLPNNEPHQYIPQSCTVCRYRVFDATEDSCGKIEIKCSKCGHITNILIGDVEKSAFAA